MIATRQSAQKATLSLTPSGQLSATDLSKLAVGDEFVVTWADDDQQRYKVIEVRGSFIVRKRWIAHLSKWTEWDGVQKISEVCRHKVEMA